MSENPAQTVKIPVEDHGLHKHNANVPRIFTGNFFEHLPVYSFEFKKGNRLKYTYSFFNRLQPLPVPALVTGQTKVCGFFVPYESIFRGWYDFDQKVPHVFSDGTSGFLSSARYVSMSLLSKEFVGNTNLVSAATSADYDILYIDSNNVTSYYYFRSLGASVYKVLCALGLPLSFDENDTFEPNCLKVLAYLRIMYDHYFPLNYYQNTVANQLYNLFTADIPSSIHVDESDLLDLLTHCVFGWFDSSFVESCWDKPVAPNVGVGLVSVKDTSNDANPMHVTNSPTDAGSPSASYRPSNGTPYVANAVSGSTTVPAGVITQFVIDALQSVNNFVKRHGLSGNRIIENFLSSRGVSLPDDVYPMSSKLADYSIPFEITAVENNSDTNLGELAGRGETSGKELRFNARFKSDGLFFIFHTSIPDSEVLCATDPYNLCKSPLDFHHSGFEKLGVDAVPSRVLFQDTIATHNRTINSQLFGFLKRYYYGNVDVPLIFGDFRVVSRGSQSLGEYHTFRSLDTYLAANNYNLAHSYDFLRVGADHHQFGRIFYTGKGDHFTVVARIKGKRWTNFLPFGDAYDWDDDEMNQKVVVQNSGNDTI